jgi:hypothetical protein
VASGDPTRSSTIAEASTMTSSGMTLELVLGAVTADAMALCSIPSRRIERTSSSQ